MRAPRAVMDWARARLGGAPSALEPEGRFEELSVRLDQTEHSLVRLEVRAAALEDDLRRVDAGAVQGAAPVDDAEVWRWRRQVAAAFSRPDREVAVGPGLTAVRAETQVGPMLLPTDDEVVTPWILVHGWWAKEEADELKTLLGPGMTFVDVGAHVGYLTLVAARAVGPTGRGLAFEPAPCNVALLRANLSMAGADHVQALPVAAWERTSRLALSLSPDNSGDHRAYRREATESVEVTALALDDVVPTDVTVDVMKIDTQGTDHLVVRGAKDTIARSRPVLLVEFWPPGIEQFGHDPLEVLAFYRGLEGYEVRVLGGPSTGPPPAPEDLVGAALSAEGNYCTLKLRPEPVSRPPSRPRPTP